MHNSVTKTPQSVQTSYTRPQTALTHTKQILMSQPSEDGLDTSIKNNRYTNPTSLTPRSLKKLQERKRVEGISKSEVGTCNLRVKNDQAEIDGPEDYFDKELKINVDEYDQFRKNFHRIVFDAFGNYIYTKPEALDDELKQQVNSALNTKTKVTSQNLQRKLMLKTQSFQPRKIIDGLVKNASEIATMNPRRKNIMDIKQRAEQTLHQMIQNVAKDKILAESKALLHGISLQMLNQVDKFIRENSELKDQLEMAKNKIFELQSSNESLNFKNQQLQKELKQSKVQLDDIKRVSVDLEKFLPEYRIMTKKFVDFSAEKIIDRYEYFENTVLTLTKKTADLEEDKRFLEKSLQQQKREFESKIQDLSMYKVQQSSNQNQNQDQPNKELEQYKEMYMTLFKKIMNVYCNWTTKAKALLPDKMDDGPRANLVDPIEMLSNLEKMIQISSNEKLQAYLRKVIVSANLLQRKYFPEEVNLKFDPDKIYDRLVKYIDNQSSVILGYQNREKDMKKQQRNFKQEDEHQILKEAIASDKVTDMIKKDSNSINLIRKRLFSNDSGSQVDPEKVVEKLFKLIETQSLQIKSLASKEKFNQRSLKQLLKTEDDNQDINEFIINFELEK
ncbi:unnamed protein product (macronuclear) [Paramecium tetraurelia]|uniref:Uncharacterized protein n=1 Tax=Paramecium tetraurelia TaxID=5888 RepID=A0BKJ5_PARTE|nr:uncharacterized protein GSPATT00029693001 [Paramecium tetraurelia]CAK59062.1 unnamed protein product [Paramecium tetraurelia]|eukprot:XP_001426460.1 hypothetical protein (macronuclear) [Paramecium tetraurelia strain d4-2]